MDKLEIYEKVNACETGKQLSEVILEIAEETGTIQGRIKKFDAIKMSIRIKDVIEGIVKPNTLTREFGIRQQALYIKYYEELENSSK